MTNSILLIKLSLVTLLVIVLSNCQSSGPKPTVTKPVEIKKPTTTTELPASDQSLYDQALRQLRIDAKKSHKSIARLAKKHPTHLGLQVNLAIALYYSGNYDQALSQAKAIMQHDNSIVQLHNLAGMIAIEKKTI